METAENMAAKEQIRKDTQEGLKADEALLRKMERLQKELHSKHTAIVDARKAHIQNIFSDYKTEEEAHEAYGYGIISESEYNNIRDAFCNGEAKIDNDTRYSIMKQWTSQWIRQLKNEINELKYQLMTPKQQAEHDKAVADWNKKIEKAKAHRR